MGLNTPATPGANDMRPGLTNARRQQALRVLVLVTAVLCAGPTAAQSNPWRKIEHSPTALGLPSTAAVVSNTRGYGLSVFMADPSRLMAVFSLPPGLRALDTSGCPTFKVDSSQPEPLHLPPGRCKASGAEARVEIGQVVNGELDSEVLRQLLNGSSLEVIHRLASAGYQAAQFSLKGSKNALLAALPAGTTIVGE